MTDDDLVGPGVEPGARVVPGSRRSMRQAYYEDDGLSVISGDDRPKRKGAIKPKSMYDRWRAIMEPALFGTRAEAHVSQPLFNKHVAQMRVKYSDVEIERAFQAFAEASRAGSVPFNTPSAWLVFYKGRERYLQWAEKATPKRERRITRL